MWIWILRAGERVSNATTNDDKVAEVMMDAYHSNVLEF
jgi:hypothetical protein